MDVDLSTTLLYTVSKCSSYSSNFEPSNILVDNPCDQASRWSSESNSPPQYLVLQLEKTAVLGTIKFGKYEKTHVCNLKRFKIYAGLTENNMIEVLESGLKNDHVPEYLSVKNRIDGQYLPVKYVKIVPLQSWGTSFNFSIWYVELLGTDDTSILQTVVERYLQYREKETIRLCLKHFRQRCYLEAYESLRKKTKISLEAPILERLHDSLVTQGDYKACEEIIESAAADGLFSHYINNQGYHVRWSKIEPVNRDGSDHRPGQRGGHQMVIDPHTETLYLFGGWDGDSDLADFWSFHVPSQQWKCISTNTEQDGGPTARSCHKMVIDYERKHIFILGRYVEPERWTAENLKCEFYVYDINQNKWLTITNDTASMGGPELLFDHQMAMDLENQVIFVFGGKLLQSPSECSSNYSGLYSYHIPTNHWRKIRADGPDMRSRFGHSMLFNERSRQLYIFAGQRGMDYLNDFFSYDVDNDSVHVISDNSFSRENSPGPPSGYTQRATLDVECGTMHVLLGLSKKKRDCLNNPLWVYDLNSKTWTCLTSGNSSKAREPIVDDSNCEPVPRFAHQLVYDHVKKVHYMFGGNPGLTKSVRLDDFWCLNLCRPSIDYVVRKCKVLIRKSKFKELTNEDPVRALQYLQNDLSEVIDHTNTRETSEFHKLATSLFEEEEEITVDSASYSKEHIPAYYTRRSDLFDSLVEYFPPHMTQPRRNLLDMVSIE